MANVFTEGEFATEEAAWSFFDEWISRSEGFRVYREVEGRYVVSRPFSVQKSPRIDRVLVPTKKLVDAGWRYGPIGVEGKRSGHKVGKLILQALDYSWATFEIMPGFHMWLESVFVYPLEMPIGDIASLMTQNRIGCIRTRPGSKRCPITFQMGGTNVIELLLDCSSDVTQIEIHTKDMVSGHKRGSR